MRFSPSSLYCLNAAVLLGLVEYKAAAAAKASRRKNAPVKGKTGNKSRLPTISEASEIPPSVNEEPPLSLWVGEGAKDCRYYVMVNQFYQLPQPVPSGKPKDCNGYTLSPAIWETKDNEYKYGGILVYESHPTKGGKITWWGKTAGSFPNSALHHWPSVNDNFGQAALLTPLNDAFENGKLYEVKQSIKAREDTTYYGFGLSGFELLITTNKDSSINCPTVTSPIGAHYDRLYYTMLEGGAMLVKLSDTKYRNHPKLIILEPVDAEKLHGKKENFAAARLPMAETTRLSPSSTTSQQSEKRITKGRRIPTSPVWRWLRVKKGERERILPKDEGGGIDSPFNILDDAD